MNRHAIHVRDRGRDRALAKLQAKFRGLCAANAAPHKLAEITAAIDKVGRVTRVPIKPPEKRLPEIDKQVAELFGITERMVRKCRTDPKLRPFMPHPVWLEPDWLRTAREDFEARQVAKRLMTPERYAKCEPVRFYNGGLQVPERLGPEIVSAPAPGVDNVPYNGARGEFFPPKKLTAQERVVYARLRVGATFAAPFAAWWRVKPKMTISAPWPSPNNPVYRTGLQLERHAGPPDWFATQMWLKEIEGVSERRVSMRSRFKKQGTDGNVAEFGSMLAPDPPVTAAPVTVPPYANFGQRDPD
jgi:hypothetical protein